MEDLSPSDVNCRTYSKQTNASQQKSSPQPKPNHWQTIEAIALLAAIAGLFHDFGKANRLFQAKLLASAIKRFSSEPVRHEWVSLRLFQAFVGGDSDEQWLARLFEVSPAEEKRTLENLRDIQDTAGENKPPFAALKGQLAKVVAWLIVSHHRLPKYTESNRQSAAPRFEHIDRWLTEVCRASWNSQQYTEPTKFSEKDWLAVWQFKQGLPFRSKSWCKKAKALAKRAQSYHRAHPELQEHDWLADSFVSHIARLCLMLADHCYSAGPAVKAWQGDSYAAYANTDWEDGQPKQKLDEHNLGVGHNAFVLAKHLPKLRQELPAIAEHQGFQQDSSETRFLWQNQAFDLAQTIAARSQTQGFFGINLASTGCGKTLANARIMYGLVDEKLGCRFSIALGLRTLTLQTGDALRQRLRLAEEDLAVLIGSQAVQNLHEMRNANAVDPLNPLNPAKTDAANAEGAEIAASGAIRKDLAGSESAEDLYSEYQYLRYDGKLENGHLSKWLKLSPKLQQLLSAPVLVSTIDHLMPATEGERGGKQIAPMLRLLTADLVLDEPDDFDLADLPALCRLVNWAGMLGSRVLLSSATLPPALVQALFDAYAAGRRLFNQGRGDALATSQQPICCAWFDEFDAHDAEIAALGEWAEQHQQFVAKRIHNLALKNQVLCKVELLPVQPASKSAQDVVVAMANSILAGVSRLHAAHQQVHAASGKRVSLGLVRVANIKQLVAVAQHIIQRSPPANQRIHFCIYHSQHPLIVRSEIEKMLDQALSRSKEETLWQVPTIQKALAEQPEQDQIFIVFGSPVCETGRDHDYDWAIAEPSSMRSLIQLAGRIQRHRRKSPASANLLVLQQNFLALRGEEIAYCHPGFETWNLQLKDKDLAHSLRPEQYQQISAQARIEQAKPLDAVGNLADLEHAQLQIKLFSGDAQPKFHAALWWRGPVQWCAEMQRNSPFRASNPAEEFIMQMEEEGGQALFHKIAPDGEALLKEPERFQRISIAPADGVQFWGEFRLEKLIAKMAAHEKSDLRSASRRYAQLSLPAPGKNVLIPECWCYAPEFGVYGELD